MCRELNPYPNVVERVGEVVFERVSEEDAFFPETNVVDSISMIFALSAFLTICGCMSFVIMSISLKSSFCLFFRNVIVIVPFSSSGSYEAFAGVDVSSSTSPVFFSVCRIVVRKKREYELTWKL